MKRWTSLLCACALALVLAGCGAPFSGAPSAAPGAPVPGGESQPPQSAPAQSQPEAQPLSRPVRLGALRGPTAMGMVRLMQDAETGEAAGRYEFQISGAADELVPLLVKGELDAAALPANLAAALASRADLQAAAVNTLGVLYVVTANPNIDSFEDLRGKTILSTGKGTTPEYVLAYLLAQNDIGPEEITVEYKSEAAEALAALSEGEGDAAVLPQPYVAAALDKLPKLRVALDLTGEWEKVSPDSTLVTGVLAVRREFAQQYPEALRQLLAEYEQSVGWVVQNPAEAALLIENYGITPSAAIAEQALPACNIVWLSGEEMKQKLGGYLAVLYGQDPASVGGKLPGDDFYYGV